MFLCLSLSVPLFLCLSILSRCLCPSVSVSTSIGLCLSVTLSLCLPASLCLCVFVSLCLYFFGLLVPLSLSIFFCLFLFAYIYLYHSFNTISSVFYNFLTNRWKWNSVENETKFVSSKFYENTNLGPYSQPFIFFLTYEWAQKASDCHLRAFLA